MFSTPTVGTHHSQINQLFKSAQSTDEKQFSILEPVRRWAVHIQYPYSGHSSQSDHAVVLVCSVNKTMRFLRFYYSRVPETAPENYAPNSYDAL
jgi:hypothetical protein